MIRKSLMMGLALAALMFAAPVYAQTDTNSGTMKPSATDQDKMTPAPGAQGTTGSAAPREPAGAGGADSRAGSGVTGTDSGTKKQDDTDPKPGTQR